MKPLIVSTFIASVFFGELAYAQTDYEDGSDIKTTPSTLTTTSPSTATRYQTQVDLTGAELLARYKKLVPEGVSVRFETANPNFGTIRPNAVIPAGAEFIVPRAK